MFTLKSINLFVPIPSNQLHNPYSMNILLSTIKSHLGFGPPGEVLNNEAAEYKVIQKFEVSSFWVENFWATLIKVLKLIIPHLFCLTLFVVS